MHDAIRQQVRWLPFCMQQPERLECEFVRWLRTCGHAFARMYLCASVVAMHGAAAAECVLCSPGCCPCYPLPVAATWR